MPNTTDDFNALALDSFRATTRPLSFRDVDADTTTDARIGTLFGHSTVFNRWYEVDSWVEGHFMERVAPGAAADSIAERAPVVFFNHGRDMQIGQKPLGVHEELREDDVGVYYQVPLLDTSYNRDLLPGLKAGAYGSSFRFQPLADSWVNEPERTDANPNGIPERTITQYTLVEHGPVTFPANAAANAGARSVCSTTDDFYAALRAGDPDGFDELAARARQLRTAVPRGNEGLPGSTASDNNHARNRALKLARKRVLQP